MNNEWDLIEKYVEKRIDLELRLIELFILTISAEIIIISLSDYKLIIIPVLVNIVAVIYLVIMMAFDLNMKKSNGTIKKYANDITFLFPLGFKEFKELIPLILYIVSIALMGFVILYPYLPKSNVAPAHPTAAELRGITTKIKGSWIFAGEFASNMYSHARIEMMDIHTFEKLNLER